jgi:phenylacetic acid degradation operon negative regulatory protein
MASLAAIETIASEFLERRPIRSTSLIITLFGDVVSQHGGVIWLGSLVEALGLIGIDERLVRTSTFRLVQEGWLEAERVGRRSFYRFTAYGKREYERAARRIYSLERPDWEGAWTLLIPLAVPEEKREQFRRSLLWQGFGSFAPNVYAHPGSDIDTVGEMLDELGLRDQVLIMNAGTDTEQSRRLIAELLWKNWGLEQLSQQYARFVRRFQPAQRALARAGKLQPGQCFKLRLLLIHEYRRILLHDTDLPQSLLPRNWPGATAQKLTAEIYRAVAAGSLDYISSQLQSADAPMPAAAASFRGRFGGRPSRSQEPT